MADHSQASSVGEPSQHREKQQMSCNIGQKNTRVLAAALSTLAKIGFDLLIEADESGLTLRALNDSQSAFLSIGLSGRGGENAGFFERYLAPDENLKVKLTSKFLLHAFRSLKQVLSLQLSFDNDTATPSLKFEFSCEQGIKKTHCFQVTECEILQAVFPGLENQEIMKNQEFDV